MTTNNERTQKILEAIAVTAELTDTTLSGPAIAQMTRDLLDYPHASVLNALAKCRRELTHRLTLAAIIDRLEDTDGRPQADEAWSTALTAHDETATVVWTTEMAQAYGIAKPLLDKRDEIGARMAFRAAYQRITDQARSQKQPTKWMPSLGSDPNLRAAALQAAVEQGKLGQQHVAGLLPAPEKDNDTQALLAITNEIGRRTGKRASLLQLLPNRATTNENRRGAGKGNA
jgi:hypothetical protein